ncbi:MAG TPA: serine/threonine-protein kinase, partial [Candidatus Dormibacteraeota bacterium]
MKLEPGTNLGPYRIVGEAGRGGMASVYKAHQAALARYVAIKVLPDFFATEPGFLERFQQEAVAVAQLRHPNILAIFDYGDTDGVTYIVTEFVDGGTLAEQMGKPLPVEYAVEILNPIAGALDYAHRRGVLHRDIKPSNVLLQHDGTPVLSDFGLAKMMMSANKRITQSGMIVGTPEYMSPEQCAGEDLTPATDQYSLAVIAYEALTGRVPFTAATPVAVLMAQMQNALPPPRTINPELSD